MVGYINHMEFINLVPPVEASLACLHVPNLWGLKNWVFSLFHAL